MSLFDKKFDKKEDKKEVSESTTTPSHNIDHAELIRAAIAAAIAPLQKEIANLRGEVKELKQVADKPKAAAAVTAVIDEATKNEIKNMMENAAKGIDSYKYPVYALFIIAAILAVAILWNNYKLKDTAENMDWRYDAVTGILSGDRHYWWDGENFQNSRTAPEAKRLQEALDHYQKKAEQIKKQAGNN